jgi:hypothetical protein
MTYRALFACLLLTVVMQGNADAGLFGWWRCRPSQSKSVSAACHRGHPCCVKEMKASASGELEHLREKVRDLELRVEELERKVSSTDPQ